VLVVTARHTNTGTFLGLEPVILSVSFGVTRRAAVRAAAVSGSWKKQKLESVRA
jgi:hypothetical protein